MAHSSDTKSENLNRLAQCFDWAVRNADKLFYGLLAICLSLLSIDLFYHKHGHFEFETWFGFFAFFGLSAYATIVLSAKQLRRVLKRDENYYDS